MALGGAALGTAIGYLMLDTTGFQSGFRSAMNDLRTFQSESTTVGGKFKALGSAMTSVGGSLTKGVTLPLVGIGAASVKAAAEFESGMKKVQAVSGASASDMEKLEAKAKEMGATTKFSASESAEAFNYMAMAGWKTNDMLNGIEGIMNLAAASGEDLALTSDIVTDALTGFGLSAKDAGMFADVLAAASSNANTNVAMLGESFKYVAPVAGALGYSVQDTSIALGLMANAGIKASQGGTTLRTILTNMVNPTDTMKSAMDSLGVSLTDGAGNMKSLREVMVDLREGFKGTAAEQDVFAQKTRELSEAFKSGKISQEEYSEGMNTLLSDTDLLSQSQMAQTAAMLAGKEGMSGLLAIVNASDEDFNKLADAIDNSTGKAKEMSDIMMDSLEGQMTLLGSAAEGAAIAFGQLLIPVLVPVIQKLQELFTWLTNLDPGIQQMIVTIGLAAAAVGPILMIIGQISSGIGTIIGLVTNLGPVIGALTGPIGIIIAAVSALALAWATDFAGIRETTSEILNAISTLVTTIMSAIKSAWENDLNGIRTVAESIWNLIKTVFETAFTIIKDLFAVFSAAFQGDWSGMWEAVKTLVSDIWEGIKSLVDAALSAIISIIVSIAGALYNAATTAFNKIKEGFSNVWDKIKSWFNKAKEDPVQALKDLGSALFNAAKGAFTKILDGFKSIWNSITSWVTDKVNWIKNKFAEITGAASGIASASARGSNPGKNLQGHYAAGLDYIPRDMDVRVHEGEAILTAQENRNRTRTQSGGDTFNFYSPEPLTPVKAAREFKRVKQELALGYR